MRNLSLFKSSQVYLSKVRKLQVKEHSERREVSKVYCTSSVSVLLWYVRTHQGGWSSVNILRTRG